MKIIVGIDIGGTKCAVTFAAPQGDRFDFLDKVKEHTITDSPRQAIARFITLIRERLEKNPSWVLAAIGISCGGPLDAGRGLILAPPNLPLWDNVDIYTPLKQAFGVPVAMENDANACALAEWVYGAGKGTRNMVFLTFGTGMGAGLILGGKLYAGTNDMAGEVGHIRMAQEGPEGYGKQGSFEGFCSGGGIAQYVSARVMEARQRGETLDFPWECGVSGAKDLGQAAEAGSLAARRIWEEIGEYFGRGLAILCDILNPERIVAGGVYMRSGKWMQEGIRRTLEAEALSPIPVAPAQLGEKIGDVAALTVAAYGLAQGKK